MQINHDLVRFCVKTRVVFVNVGLIRPIPGGALVPAALGDSMPFRDAPWDDKDPGLALGFNGDNTCGRAGGATGPSLTFRRTAGRPGAELGPPPALVGGRVSTVKPDGPSPPNVCRRAFS